MPEIVTYGKGGVDATKPEGNVVERRVMQLPADEANHQAILDAARQALATNRTFVGLASPTNAQNAAQLMALTRQMNGVIRLLLGALDATD